MGIFQTRLKELRKRSGKTQAQIAKELEVTPQAFSYYINGRDPDYDTLVRMAKYFNVSTDYLLGNSDVTKLENENTFKKLGLSDFSIKVLEDLNINNKKLLTVLDELLDDEKFILALEQICEAQDVTAKIINELAEYQPLTQKDIDKLDEIEKMTKYIEDNSDRFVVTDFEYRKLLVADIELKLSHAIKPIILEDQYRLYCEECD